MAYSLIRGGNDFESWYVSGNTYVSYGSDAISWLTAYNNANAGYCYNYGSDCSSEYPARWSKMEVYNVSYGIMCAQVLLEIYYTNIDKMAKQWTDLTTYLSANGGYIIKYKGITGDSYFSTEWTTFNTKLTNAGFSNYLTSCATRGF